MSYMIPASKIFECLICSVFLTAFRSILEQLAELRSSHGQETGPDRLVREAAQGHVEVVKDILIKYPDKVMPFHP